MTNVYFSDDDDDTFLLNLDGDNLCPICNEDIPESDKITLKCNHSFCYGCLLESYKGTKCNFSVSSSKNHRICPYCRTPSGFLSLKPGMTPIKGIHREFGKSKCIIYNQCKGIIKSGVNKGKQCSCKARPNSDYCGKHKYSGQTITNLPNLPNVTNVTNITNVPINI